MVPIPIDFKELQPFKVVRQNWSSLKPYHDNYITTISFATVLTAFLGTVSLMVKHGFKMPRLHPMIDIDEMEPSPGLSHPNEYISERELVEVKAFEFEQAVKWEMIIEEAERLAMAEEKEIKAADVAEEQFKESTEAGLENAMDILNDEGVFEVELDEATDKPED